MCRQLDVFRDELPRDSTSTELTTIFGLIFDGYPWRPFGAYFPVRLSLGGCLRLARVIIEELNGMEVGQTSHMLILNARVESVGMVPKVRVRRRTTCGRT